MTMEKTIEKIRTSWALIEHKLREEYPNLNDKDFTYQEGKEQELFDNIVQVTAKTQDEVREFINSCC